MSSVKKLTGKPRLLLILNRFVIGGPAVDTIPLAWYLKENFDIIIIHGEKEKDEIEPLFLLKKYPGLHLKKIKHLSSSFNPLFDINAFFQVLRILLTFRPHIVHTHGAKAGFTGRIAAWLLRVPVIIHTYHGHFFHSYFSKKMSAFVAFAEHVAGKVTTSAIALSQSQKDDLVDKYKVLPAAKIAVISLGFDFDNSTHREDLRQDFRKRYNLQKTDVAIGIISRIVNVKNHSFFVKIIDRILTGSKTNSPAFFFVGDGDLRVSVENELGLKNIRYSNKAISQQNRVVFTSWITDIDEVLNGLDIVVLTSLNEGTPLSIIEAQFFKKPVIATNVGGVKDSLEDEVSGFLIKKNDVIAFYEKLLLLVNNKTLRDTMGEAGHTFVSANFSKQQEVTKIKALYFSLLNKKGYYSH